MAHVLPTICLPVYLALLFVYVTCLQAFAITTLFSTRVLLEAALLDILCSCPPHCKSYNPTPTNP